MSFYKYTYYQVLGLQPAVNSWEIKHAYRRLVKSLHPDIGHKKQSASEQAEATKRMAKLNEAYETLKDKSTRAAYDSLIGVNGRGNAKTIKTPFENNELLADQYLKQVFQPVAHKISRILLQYKKQLAQLSQDIYDEALVKEFERYTNEIESVLRNSSRTLSKHAAPTSLSAAELMMRHSIAQAADGLEELRHYCGNYDYNHLIMAGNLFKESNALSKQALNLTRIC